MANSTRSQPPIARTPRHSQDRPRRSQLTALSPADPTPVVGNIYECYAPLKEIMTAEVPGKLALTATAALSDLQTRTMNDYETWTKSAVRDSAKLRPCLMLEGHRDDLYPSFVMLSTLEDFQPHFFCCITQHFLRAIHDTPSWPRPDSYRLRIHPGWPRQDDTSKQHYVLVIKARLSILPAHYKLCTFTDEQGTEIPYTVSTADQSHLLTLASTLLESFVALPSEIRSRYNESYETSQKFYQKLSRLRRSAQKAKRREFTLEEMSELEVLFTKHVHTVERALHSPEHPDHGLVREPWEVEHGRPQLTPYHVPEKFRSYFPMQQGDSFSPPPFDTKWPSLKIPGGIMSRHVAMLTPHVMSLEDRAVTETSLGELLVEIIRVVSSTTNHVHPGFARADSDTLAAWIRGDRELSIIMRRIHTASLDGLLTFPGDVARIRNYICMRL